MLDASPNTSARQKQNAPAVESTRKGECAALAPMHAASEAARDKPAADAAAVALSTTPIPILGLENRT
jgi:hypothetical protein